MVPRTFERRNGMERLRINRKRERDTRSRSWNMNVGPWTFLSCAYQHPSQGAYLRITVCCASCHSLMHSVIPAKCE